MRLLIAAAIALFAIVSYYGRPGDENQITGAVERVAYTEESDEIALGLQARSELAHQFGGFMRGPHAERVERIGRELVQALERDLQGKGRRNPYQFDFHLLADPNTINAFALPGGQVFITAALYQRLETDGQLAGVLGHEIGHVIARHGNKRMAQDQLFTGLATAAGVGGGDVNSMRMAQMAKQMVSMKYGREDELESDMWGVELCLLAHYDPRAMFEVMRVLDEASGGAGGPPEMLSTHPKPANRIEYIRAVINRVTAERYPEGLPPDLKP